LHFNIFLTPKAEDKKFLKISTETLSNEDSMTERMRRIHQNDLENILPWALVVCAYMFVSVKDIMNPGARLWNEIIGTVLISLFTLSRIAFMIVYWAQLQPWRTLAFFVGNMLLVTLGLYTIVMAFIPWYDMRK
jgi:uncharacterized MAPEG superfamily protein